MKPVALHSFIYILKVWLTGVLLTIMVFILMFIKRPDFVLLHLSDPQLAFSILFAAIICSLQVAAMIFLVVRYTYRLQWNTVLIKFVLTILWLVASCLSLVLVGVLQLLVRDLLLNTPTRLLGVSEYDLFKEAIVGIWTVWILISPFCVWFYKIKPAETSRSTQAGPDTTDSP